MYVIAGVTGHVGSVVANELLASANKIKVIVRDGKKAASWSSRGAEVALGSLEDEAFLTKALKGATGFFTLLPASYQAKDFLANQRKTADTIAAAVKASGVPHVVVLSSVGADLESGTGPIRGLYYLENALRKTSATLTILRAGFFQENAAQSIDVAKQKGIFPNFGSADQAFPQIATRDIAKVAAQSLLSPPAKTEVVDLEGPPYSTRQVAEKLGQALGKNLGIVDIPRDQWVPALMQAGLSSDLAPIMAEMYDAFAKRLLKPKGDRMVKGTTPLDETIRGLVH
jgi:uncharacterized protein YbjT (DUF2867 family)